MFMAFSISLEVVTTSRYIFKAIMISEFDCYIKSKLCYIIIFRKYSFC